MSLMRFHFLSLLHCHRGRQAAMDHHMAIEGDEAAVFAPPVGLDSGWVEVADVEEPEVRRVIG